MSDVVPAYADQLMAFPKLCNVTLTWSERDNHAGLLLATAQPEDTTGAILPGMTLQLVVKRPLVVDRCLYELGLFQLDHGMRRRVYQLNVTPAHTTAPTDRCMGRMSLPGRSERRNTAMRSMEVA